MSVKLLLRTALILRKSTPRTLNERPGRVYFVNLTDSTFFTLEHEKCRFSLDGNAFISNFARAEH
jgi:hypothetical protein